MEWTKIRPPARSPILDKAAGRSPASGRVLRTVLGQRTAECVNGRLEHPWTAVVIIEPAGLEKISRAS